EAREAGRRARARPRAAHLAKLAASRAELLDDDADVRLRDVDDDFLVRLERLTVRTRARDHARARHRELVPLAAHRLDQDPQVQLAAPGDGEGVGRVRVLDPQRDVALQLAHEPLADLTARHELPLAPGER